MLRLRKVWTLGVLATLAADCSDDTGPSEDELVGTWNATELEFVAGGLTVDAIEFGATLRMVLRGDNTYTITITFPGEPAESESGTWSASKDVLTLSDSSGEMQFDMSLQGNTLTLANADSEFDIDDDGVDEPVKVNLTLVRG